MQIPTSIGKVLSLPAEALSGCPVSRSPVPVPQSSVPISHTMCLLFRRLILSVKFYSVREFFQKQ